MSQPFEPYISITVETFIDARTGKVRVRPLPDEGYPPNIVVECPRSVRSQYPVGTRFKISAKLTDRDGGQPYLYSHHSWPMTVVETPRRSGPR